VGVIIFEKHHLFTKFIASSASNFCPAFATAD